MALHYGTDRDIREEFEDDEIEVADILLELPTLTAISEYNSTRYKSWLCKKKRSAIANLTKQRAVRSISSLSPSLSLFGVPLCVGSSASEPERPRATVKDEQATSPATPLSFSPSEFEEKPKHSKRKLCVKETRKDMRKIASELTESNELLRGEIQKVTQYYWQLEATNSSLKARKQELSQMNSLMNLGQAAAIKFPAVTDDQAHHLPPQMPGISIYQLPFSMDQMPNKQEVSYNHPNPYEQRMFLFQSTSTARASSTSSSSRLGVVAGNVGLRGIPDPTVTTIGKSTWKVDNKNLDRFMAAQARQRRMLIYKNKNPNCSSKLRFSVR